MNVLPYTLERLMDQQAVIERDEATVDQYGGSIGSVWQTVATVACKMWWQRQSSRGPSREVYGPQSTVALSDGGAILPAGTDITPRDRIARFTDPDGNVLVDGPFEVTTMLEQGQFIELAFRRT